MKRKNLLFIFCFLLTIQISFAQNTQQPKPGTDTVQVVDILHADKLGFSKKDTANVVQYGVGKVIAQQNNTIFNADSAVMNQKTKIFEAFGNVHINDADTANIFSQYLRYYSDKKLAILQKKVHLTDSKSDLTTEEMEYDVNQKVGTYMNGGKVVSGTSVLTSKEGTYYADLKDVYFRKNVVLVDPKYKLYADSLLYNTQSEIATFIGRTTIIDSSGREIHTTEGFYDVKNKIAHFTKRSTIKDGKTILTANSIFTDDASGKRIAEGNAVYIDSTQGISVIANLLEADGKKNTLLATKSPLLIIKQDEDSIYVTADSIFSGRLPDSLFRDTSSKRGKIKGVKTENTNSDSSNRYLQAYHHVRIFSDSLQAVADSMYYSGLDSIFRFFSNPIIWAAKNQITGDTIYLYTKNKKAERLYVFENGLVVGRTKGEYFNQVKGNTIDGYFKDGVMDHMQAKGNAESIYYIRDEDSAYVGVNRSTADIIDMLFKDKELNKVIYRNDVQGTTSPIKQINPAEMRLRNFKWLEDLRPKTKSELFGD